MNGNPKEATVPEAWQKVVRITAGFLAALVFLPILQMVMRESPLDEIDLSQIRIPVEAAETEKTSQQKGNSVGTVSPETQTRTEKLNASGILGRIPQPPPMALIGIAEPFAFVRTPKGQTGKVKEGESLGGVKVLRVEANRILVEHEGRKSELKIFSGIGSQSLLSN